MIKHYEKFIFLIVIIAAIFFARMVYPNIAGTPPAADATQTVNTQPSAPPPALVLPQTTLDASAPLNGNNQNNISAALWTLVGLFGLAAAVGLYILVRKAYNG